MRGILTFEEETAANSTATSYRKLVHREKTGDVKVKVEVTYWGGGGASKMDLQDFRHEILATRMFFIGSKGPTFWKKEKKKTS